MAQKENRHAGIYLNTSIMRKLTWIADHVEASDGVHLLSALKWGPTDLVQGVHRDEFALVDASGTGLGLFFPWLNFGFHTSLPCNAPTDTIFFFEALAICSAIHRVSAWRTANRNVERLAVLSDNTNAVHIFNMLRASPPYNPTLMSSVNVMIRDHLQVHVDHIPGAHNTVADALSCGELDKAQQLAPGIQLFTFILPRDALGALSQ